MTFRLRQIEVTAAGREIVRDRDVAKPQLTVGRAAENDIHLPDLAIEPSHATIAAAGDSRIEVKALGTLGFALDGAAVTEAVIDARSGAELRFGSFRITVSREEDGAVLLLIRAVADAGGKGDLEEKLGFSLAGILPGKRKASWIAVAVIVLLFLFLPIGSYLSRGATGTVIGDSSWSTGKLSLAHHSLEGKCESCHVRAFVSVRDETCLSCHKTVGDHAAHPRLAEARSGAPFGTKILAAVAHTFGKEGPGSCASCHVEHEGVTRMAAPAQQFCADCHAALKENVPDTLLGDAGDFGTRHPQFTPAVVTDPFAGKRTPVSLDANPHENSGLTFPHKLHLDKLGGVARMAASIGSERGYGAKGLECSDCHHPTEDGLRFKPIEMERDCEGCHSLAYDKVGTIFRRLRHGDVEQMIADLSVSRNFDRPVVTGRERPGDYAEGRPYHFAFSAPAYNTALIGRALSRDGVCGECHTPTFENGMPNVVPVTLVSRYMQQGWFDHNAHKQEKCTSCHMAEKSSSSADLLLPGIKSCRTCHLGEDAANAEVPSGCAMCHSYHPPFAAPGRDRLARK
jgi:hypothetical protein